MKRLFAAAMCLLLFSAWTLPGVAADYVPSTINHQGVVRVEEEPFTGAGAFRFALVSPDIAGPTNVWTNDGTEIGTPNMPVSAVSLPVDQGLYQVNLGDTAAGMVPLDAEVFSYGATMALRIWFDDGVHGVQQLAPDQPITTIPFTHVAQYALEAIDCVTIQGQMPTDFATYDHTHTLSDLPGMLTDAQVPDNITINRATGAGTADNALLLNGQSGSYYATATHSHSLSSLGGTLSNGQLPAEITVDQVNYTTPRTQYYAVAEPDWQGRESTTEYKMVLGAGGVYVTSAGTHMLVAPVHLPHGATVTSVTVAFYKQAGHTTNLEVDLKRYNPGFTYHDIAKTSTEGITGFDSVTVDTSTSPFRLVNNIDNNYLVRAYATDWGNGNLKVMHVSIAYTLASAL